VRTVFYVYLKQPLLRIPKMKQHKSMEAGVHPTTEILRYINTIKLHT